MISIIYGFCSGAHVSLLPVPVVMMGDMHDSGRRIRIAVSVVTIGSIAGPSISRAIFQVTDGFKAAGFTEVSSYDHPLPPLTRY